MGMILSYFAIITGIFEIPDYRYRLCGRTHRRVYIRLCIVGNTFKRELTVSLADE